MRQVRQMKLFHSDKKWSYLLTGAFLITNSLNLDYLLRGKRLCCSMGFLSAVTLVLFSIENIQFPGDLNQIMEV